MDDLKTHSSIYSNKTEAQLEFKILRKLIVHYEIISEQKEQF